MYSTSSGRGFLPLVTAAHEISPTCSCMLNPGEGRGVYDTHPACEQTSHPPTIRGTNSNFSDTHEIPVLITILTTHWA